MLFFLGYFYFLRQGLKFKHTSDIWISVVTSGPAWPVLSFRAHKRPGFLTSWWAYDSSAHCVVTSMLEHFIVHGRHAQHSLFQMMSYSLRWLIFQPGSWERRAQSRAPTWPWATTDWDSGILCYCSITKPILIYTFFYLLPWNALKVFCLKGTEKKKLKAFGGLCIHEHFCFTRKEMTSQIQSNWIGRLLSKAKDNFFFFLRAVNSLQLLTVLLADASDRGGWIKR